MARVKTLAGHPIEQHSSPNVGGRMSSHRGIVLHIAEGTYRGTINWQMNPDQRYSSGGSTTTSSTWIVGRQEGEWAQMSDSDIIAWCQRGGSRDWNSIELAGYAPSAPTTWQIEACAQLLAWHHRTYGTPLAVADHPGERGLGHHSMDREWLGEEWGHDSCPGSGVIAAKAAIVKRAKAIVAGEDDDMPLDNADVMKVWTWDLKNGDGVDPAYVVLNRAAAEATRARLTSEAVLAAVKGLDTKAVLARINEVATAEAARDQAAAAERAELAELVRRGQAGELDAAEVVRLIGERLTADTPQAQG